MTEQAKVRKTQMERLWRLNNRDRVLAKKARYREKNHEVVLARHRQYNDLNRDAVKLASREAHLMRLYGITVEVFERLSVIQDGCCAICGARTVLTVDHDHLFGNVRGLLCGACNAGIGQLKDDPALCRRAVVYLGGNC